MYGRVAPLVLGLLWGGTASTPTPHPTPPPTKAPTLDPDLRVSKAHRARGYNQVRVSVVDRGLAPRPDDFFEYNKQFMHSFKTYHLHTTIKDIDEASGSSTFTIAGRNVTINLPKKGGRTRGLMIADPCYDGTGGFQCMWEKEFLIPETLLKVITAVVGSDEIDFWGIMGDNFYESNQSGGPVAKKFFEQLPLSVKRKLFLTVPGNHDFWLAGEPPGQKPEIDQYGYGFLQMYGQDTEFATKNLSDRANPYDFSVPPAIGSLPIMDNFIFSNQIGDIAFFGYSGAHSREELQPKLEGFCEWVKDESSINVAVILGHWDQDNLGCKGRMATKEIFADAKLMPGCSDKQIMFFDGHEHCNYIHPDFPNEGFLVGGNGMWGGGDKGCCGGGDPCRENQQFGFVILDSDPSIGEPGNTTRVDYFQIAKSINGQPRYGGTVVSVWAELQECLEANPDQPYTACRDAHSVPWRSRPEVAKPSPFPTPVPGVPTPAPDSPTPASSSGMSKDTIIVIAGVVMGVGLLLVVFALLCIHKAKMQQDAAKEGLLQSAEPPQATFHSSHDLSAE